MEVLVVLNCLSRTSFSFSDEVECVVPVPVVPVSDLGRDGDDDLVPGRPDVLCPCAGLELPPPPPRAPPVLDVPTVLSLRRSLSSPPLWRPCRIQDWCGDVIVFSALGGLWDSLVSVFYSRIHLRPLLLRSVLLPPPLPASGDVRRCGYA